MGLQLLQRLLWLRESVKFKKKKEKSIENKEGGKKSPDAPFLFLAAQQEVLPLEKKRVCEEI
jgi:hypothetical protein